MPVPHTLRACFTSVSFACAPGLGEVGGKGDIPEKSAMISAIKELKRGLPVCHQAMLVQEIDRQMMCFSLA
jgi:hypothetical protein